MPGKRDDAFGRILNYDLLEIVGGGVKVAKTVGVPHDSLGEGLMIAGDIDGAIASYERSLELNPGNANAVDMIARIREGGE